MATRLYLRSTITNVATRLRLSTVPGTAVASDVVNSTASGTEIQWTDGAGGSAVEWVSPPLAAVTISGAVTFNIWVRESSMNANCGGRARLYKVSNDLATWTLMGGGPHDDGVEFGFAAGNTVFNWTGTPTTNNVLAAGERLGVRLFITAAGGTMAAFNCTLGYDDDVAAADGDTYIETVENLTQWLEVPSLTENLEIDDVGQGETQLIGPTIHVTESITAVLSAAGAGDLTRAIPDEGLKVSETVTPVLTPLQTTVSEAVRVSEDETATLTPLQASPAEAVKVSDAVSAALTLQANPSQAVKVSEAVTPALTPLQASLSESVRVAEDETATLTPLQAAPAEAVKVTDTLTPPTLGGPDVLTASLTEAIKVSEDETVTLTPEEAALTEAVKVSESVTAAMSLSASLTEAVKVSESVAVLRLPLEATIAEAIKVTDILTPPQRIDAGTLTASPSENLKVDDVGQGVTQLIGRIKVQDGPIQVSLGSLAVTTISESVRVIDADDSWAQIPVDEPIRVTDTLTPPVLVDVGTLVASPSEAVKVSEDETATLTPLQATGSEAIKVTDTLTPPVLAGPDTLTAAPSESIKVSDAITAVLTPLVASLSEAVKVTDILSPPQRIDSGTLIASPSEALKVSEDETVTLTPEETALTEAIRVSESVTAQVTPLQTSMAEAVKVSDAGIVASQALSPAGLSEAVKVADTVSVLLTLLQASISEAVRIADSVTAQVTPLLVSLQEAVKVSEAGTASSGLIATPGEAVRVSEALQAQFTTLVRSLTTESVKVADSVPQVVRQDLGTQSVQVTESVKVSDAVAARFATLVVNLTEVLDIDDAGFFVSRGAGLALAEGIKVSDTVTITRDLERAVSSETVRVRDTVAAQITVLRVILAESVRVRDSLPVLASTQPDIITGGSATINDIARTSTVTDLGHNARVSDLGRTATVRPS